MNLLITICARGGSKGIPGKNIKPVNKKPLIAYSINCAFEFAKLFPADIALSTDDEEIKSVAASFNLKTDYTRPAELATDTAGKIGVLMDLWRHEEKKNNRQYDYFLDLDVTSPLRTTADLTAAFEMIRQRPDAYNLFSVSPAHRNPYFNMVEESENGFFKICKPLPSHIHSRQSAPKVYDANASFYFYSRKFFQDEMQSAATDKTLVYVVPHTCFDLDEPLDYEFLSYLLENNKLNFTI